MRSFQKFTLLTVFFVYLVIFAGGLVRVTGAGLGCPDWPKCFGRWIPPTSIEQLPPDIDPAQFNITLAWIEYTNRLVGMIVGILISALAVWAILRFRKYKRIVWGTIAAAALVAFQGWYGSIVVSSELNQTIVTVHYFLAVLIAGVLIFVYTQVYGIENKNAPSVKIPVDIRLWTMGLFLLAFVQMILGSQIRAVVEQLALNSPLLSGSERLAEVGVVSHIHLALGLTLAAAIWVFGLRIRKNLDIIPNLL
ncbi:MAG TPA: COX15/CtaA family protein, partial [candidate division Zixibacteria bacterium]|nr:COX15/CtaA family protein [candidate division Zixibacteria bacterium]